MRLLVCAIMFLSTVASASSVPILNVATHTASATTTAGPALTALPTSLVQYHTVTCFSTHAAYRDLDRYAAVDSDSPVFRKRLYSDRLSLTANYANAREITISFLKNTVRQVGNYLLTIDYGTIGNIVLRAAVRSLTPGYQLQLLDAGTWQQVTFDVATSAYMKESFPQLPALPGGENTNTLDLQLPTQLPSLTDLRWGVKYTLAHMDASALISLGLRAAVSYFDLDANINTVNAMALIDIGMHIVFRSHASVPPFHKFGDVLKSLDTIFPSLELSSLVAGLPHPPLLPFKPAEEDSLPRRPVRFTRPPISSETEKEPIVVTVYFSENPEPTSQARFVHRDADRQTEGLSGYVIFEDEAANNIMRDCLRIVVAILSTGGVVISTMKMIDGFRKAEQAKQDFIKLHALKSLAYLPWERRMALLKTLAAIQTSRVVELAPDYELETAPDIPEAQIVAHITRLVCALSHERREDFACVLEIASLPLPLPPSTPPDTVDAVLQVAPSPGDTATATAITSSTSSPSTPSSSSAPPLQTPPTPPTPSAQTTPTLPPSPPPPPSAPPPPPPSAPPPPPLSAPPTLTPTPTPTPTSTSTPQQQAGDT